MIRVRSSWLQISNLISQELNLEAFGWNIPLGLLLPALRKRAEDLGVTFIEATATSARSSGDAIHITLSNDIRNFRLPLPRRRWCKFRHAKSRRHCHRHLVL